ncbi:MAG: DNA polymerase III subunit, partial [Planctomycetes bacterium]|nr:DNA polymerase III subunit [Planctomycetota bacterium]
MSLADVKYQGHAQRFLQRTMQGRRLAHAYLLHGPEGVGKETLARSFAEVLLCSAPVDTALDPAEAEITGLESLPVGCGQCEDCRLVAAETHPDLHFVYRQLNRDHPDSAVRSRKALDLGVDVLRHFVIDRVGLTPGRGRAKVFIIREADRMTPAAQNALLKTIEEPPGVTVIMLLVTALERMLPTTLSRCQVVRFDTLPMPFIQAKLAAFLPSLPAEQLDWYARSADGSLGLALERAQDDSYSLNGRLVEHLAQLPNALRNGLAEVWTDESKALGGRYRKRDPEITDTEAGRRGFKEIFRLAALWYADILRAATGDTSTIVNATSLTQIESASETVDSAGAADAIERIARA